MEAFNFGKEAAGDWLTCESLADGPVKLKIVSMERIDGQFGKQIVLRFANGKCLGLNKTRLGDMAKIFGLGEVRPENVIDKEIEIYAGTTSFKGNETPTPRLRAEYNETERMLRREAEGAY